MKDLSKFLSEKKEEDQSQLHLAKEGEGADDKKYFAYMSEYKKNRRSDPDQADKFFDLAQQLLVNGEVSHKIKIAVAYL